MAKRTNNRNDKEMRAQSRNTFLAFVIIFGLMALFTRYFIFEIHYVSTSAMAPAYEKGSIVVMLKHDVDMDKISRGDVVLSYFGSAEGKYLRRISGVPGDLIDVREDGKYLVYTDDQGIMRQKALGDAPALVYGEIPEGAYLLLSDNLEANADDSRTLGLIYQTDISARPDITLWPL
ncbi:MAG: signal peptidase I [Clostridia bacterium]|nr:signal peptidase I [Clostridia bacterium]